MYDKFKLHLLALMAAVLPLIVRLKAVDFIGVDPGLTNISQLASGTKLNYFHYWKAVFLWVLAGALLFVLLGQIIDKKLHMKKDNKIAIALGTLVLFTAASALLSDYRHVAVWGFYDRTEGLVTYMAYFIVFLAAWSLDFTKVGLRPLKAGLMVSSALLSVMGILQFYGYNFLESNPAYLLTVPGELRENLPELAFRFKDVAYATLFNPNYVGSFAAVAVPLFLGLFLFENEKGKKALYFAFSALTFAFMVASGSRAGLVGIFSAALFIIALNRRNFKRDWKRYASVIAVFFVIAFILNFHNPDRVFGKINSLFSDIGSMLETGEGLASLGSGRGYIWYKSLGMMKKTLAMGNGPDTYIFKFPHADAFKENFNKITDKPHNLLLQIGINQGFVALLAFVFLNARLFGRFLGQVDRGFAKRCDQVLLIVGASLFGYLATSFFNDSVVSVAPLYWAFLGIFASLLLSREETARAPRFDM